MPIYILIMLTISYRDTVLLTVVFLLSGLVVQLLKHTVFVNIDRPVKYLEGSYQLHLVKGVGQYAHQSFPSGHSASAFGIFLCFALVVKQKWLKLCLFVLACLIAYSRVYLSQHFLGDILAGSLIGVITAIVCYPWIYSYNKDWLNKKLSFHKKNE